MSKREVIKNSHIDQERSNENRVLVQLDIREVYEQEFGDALEKYNAKQKRSDRKIDNYFEHVQSSKKTSTQQEMIIQIGERDDFDSQKDRDQANKILEKWFEDFQERNPQLKIYNAVIHNDEATPHLHLNFIPVAHSYKRGLEKQVAFDKAILQQDQTLDKEFPFQSWQEKERSEIGKLMSEFDIQVKKVGTHKHKEVATFKKEMRQKEELEKEIAVLKQKQVELQEMTSMVSEFEEPKLEREIKTEVEQKLFGKAEVKNVPTENYVIDPKTYSSLVDSARSGYTVKKDYDRLNRTDFVKENQKLKSENEQLTEKLEGYYYFTSELEQEKELLGKENESLKRENGSLKAEIYSLCKFVKKYVKNDFKAFFVDFMSNVKQRTMGTIGEPNSTEFERCNDNFDRMAENERERQRKKEMHGGLLDRLGDAVQISREGDSSRVNKSRYKGFDR